MSKPVQNVQECFVAAEWNACRRIETAMCRLVKAAEKRRDALEIRMGRGALQSPAYLAAAHEVMTLRHWERYMRRNCDYRRMQTENMEVKKRGKT